MQQNMHFFAKTWRKRQENYGTYREDDYGHKIKILLSGTYNVYRETNRPESIYKNEWLHEPIQAHSLQKIDSKDVSTKNTEIEMIMQE